MEKFTGWLAGIPVVTAKFRLDMAWLVAELIFFLSGAPVLPTYVI